MGVDWARWVDESDLPEDDDDDIDEEHVKVLAQMESLLHGFDAIISSGQSSHCPVASTVLTKHCL